MAGDEFGLRVGGGGAHLRVQVIGQRQLFVAAILEIGRLGAAAGCFGRPVAGVAIGIQRAGIDIQRLVAVGGGGIGDLGLFAFGRCFAILGAHFARLQQRIAFQRIADEGLDLEVRQRQQLDRLLQLRRHHQRLRLPEV